MTTTNWFARLLVPVVAAAAFVAVPAAPARAEPAFGLLPLFAGVPGRDWAPPEMSRAYGGATTYMTAAEMQTTVAALTGYSHPAFERYADVLGRFDPATGQRTTDRPSLLGVLFLQQIAASVAGDVVEREQFLDDAERLVFTRVDFAATPTDAALATFLDALHTRWLGQPAGAATVALMSGQFRAAEAAQGLPAAYARVLALLLQHGGLYFY